MQTFLPYPDFEKSAKVLDRSRLGKQRIEAKQILMILRNETDKSGWRNHPAVRMWRGHEGALAEYGAVICTEWRNRGYKDAQLSYFKRRIKKGTKPAWFGNEKFHKAHRSNLVRKDAGYYRKYFKNIKDDLPYIWPV